MKKKFSFFLIVIFNIVALLSPWYASAQNINKPNKTGPLGLQVNTLSGNLFIPRTDFSVPSRSFNLNATFFYNAFQYSENVGFGNGWNFLYNVSYQRDTTGAKTIVWGDGREDRYDSVGSNAYKAPRGFFASFTEYQPGKFSLLEPDGTQYLFENAVHKRMTKLTEQNGNSLSFQYADTLLTAIANNTGLTITLAYTNGRLSSITDAISSPTRVFTYSYDAAGNLTEVKDPLNGQHSYTYLVNGPMKTAQDENNNLVNIIYYNNFSVREMVGCNKRISFSYDSSTLTTHVVDHISSGSNQVTKYEYKKHNDIYWLAAVSGNCCGFTSKFEFDENGNKIQETDANGHLTAFGYDNRGNLLTVTDALGEKASFTYTEDFNRISSYTDKKGHVTTMTYDSKGNLVQLTEPGGRIFTATYNANGDILSSTDPKGNAYTYNYDAHGRMVSVSGPEGYTATLSYDARGNLLNYTDARSHTTSFDSDILDRLKKITNPLSKSWQFTYDANGNPVTTANENNESTLKGYDASDRLVTVTDPMGGKNYLGYDAMDNIKSLTNTVGNTVTFSYDTRNRLTGFSDALNHLTGFEYDPAGNPTSITFPNGQNLNFTYDAINRITAVSDNTGKMADFSYDRNGNVSSYTNGTGSKMTAEYDSLNRLVKLVDPLGNATGFAYDKNNNLVLITDRNGHTLTYTYDAHNRMKTRTDNNGSTVTATYDATGNMTKIKDENNNITMYTYDALNRLEKMSYPNGQYVELTYDSKSNVIAKRLTDGTSITYQYDSLNRVKTKTLPGGDVYTYAYDAAGRVVSASNSAGTVELTYDAMNRLASETFDGRTVRYAYNTAGRTQTIIYSDSTVITRTFDTRNRLLSITKNNTSLVSYEYNNANQTTKKIFANGVTTNYQYDFANRLTGYNTSNGLQQHTLFGYDKERNKTLINRLNDPSQSEEFAYDDGNRLIAYKRGTIGGAPVLQHTYTYDALGNRTAANVNGGLSVYSSNNLNQLSAISGAVNMTFTYDGNGNRTFDGVFHKRYDVEGRLLKDSASPTRIISYKYDAFGRRVVKNINGQPFKYTYSRLSPVEERDGISNSVLNQTVFNSFLTPVFNERNNTGFYYHQNELNSVEVITNAAGNLAEKYRYDPYGRLSVYDAAGNQLTGSQTGNRFGFTGQEWDSATNSYRFFFRNYSPQTGTFDQRDLIGYADGTGLYQYVHNNPANGIDILGLDDCNGRDASELYKSIADDLGHGGNRLSILSEFLKRLKVVDLGENAKFKKLSIATQLAALTTKIDMAQRNWNGMSEENRNIEIAEIEMAVIGLANDVAGNKVPGPASSFISALGAIDAFSQETTGKSLARHYAELDDAAVNLGKTAVKKNEQLFQYHEKYLKAVKKLYGENQENWTKEAREIYEIHERVLKFKKENVIVNKPKPDCPQNGPTGGTQKPNAGLLGQNATTEVISALDPNEIIGPDGFGTNKWVAAKDRLPYTITYENDKSATAPAKFVRITAPIQPKMDPASFELGSFGFNSLTFAIPSGTSSYYQRVDARDSLALYIDVTAGYDQFKNVAFWEFQSIDPTTLLPPTDPLKGFLLLQDSVKKQAGHGFANFSIRPRPTTTTGDTISAVASIVFDQNAAIETNRHKNTIDAIAPISSITGLPAMTPDTEVPLHFNGTDDADGSGVGSYSIYVSDNDGPVQLYIANFRGVDTAFRGLAEHQYKFYVSAIDNVGNKEGLKLAGSVRISDGEEVICPNGNTRFESGVIGTTYQWQVDNGSGFTNLSDGSVYSGTNTPSLSLSNAPTSFYGYQYRCLVNGTTYSNVFVVKFAMTWEGTADNAWENVANWSCTSLPDMYTDVIINGGKARYPDVSSNVFVRTLRTNGGAGVRVKSGFNLTVVK